LHQCCTIMKIIHSSSQLENLTHSLRVVFYALPPKNQTWGNRRYVLLECNSKKKNMSERGQGQKKCKVIKQLSGYRKSYCLSTKFSFSHIYGSSYPVRFVLLWIYLRYFCILKIQKWRCNQQLHKVWSDCIYLGSIRCYCNAGIYVNIIMYLIIVSYKYNYYMTLNNYRIY
jgi:hypothetical protein